MTDKRDWTRLSPLAAVTSLGSDVGQGLSQDEVTARRARHGANALQERAGRSKWRLLADQFASTLILVLLVAAAVSVAMGSIKDAVAIVAIVVLNAVLGFVQEYRAERAMAALRSLAVPSSRVRRDGREIEVPSPELVPGDVVLIEAGNLVPADGRVVQSASLKIQEAVLTGESEAVEKRADSLPGDGPLALGDQANMVFLGTSVSYGRGVFVVTATGMATELGHVADLLGGVEQTKTPLQRRLDQLGRVLAVAAVVVVAGIFGLGLLLGEDWRLMFMTAVSMAVAVVPEGLPAVVTISLALGAQRMLRRRALIRRLPAVETLGAVTVICSDKTGTLTENRMTVTALDMAGHRRDLSDTLNRGHAAGTGDPGESAAKDEPCLALLLAGGALCSDASLQSTGDEDERGGYRALGEPTEGAIVVAAARFGLLKPRLDEMCPRVAEVPFDSERKRMTTIHRIEDTSGWGGACVGLEVGSRVVFSKGAVEGLLAACTQVWDGERTQPADDGWRARITGAENELARGGMRVLGVAFRKAGEREPQAVPKTEEVERDLVFLGLIGMLDPPRPEVRQAVAKCQVAGIRPVMITGDHPVTARRIAEDLGILGDGGRVVTGVELQRLEPSELDEVVEATAVYARVAPEQKLRIVEALQRRGHVVAMTGDGVNDAPALRRADIGVAMGITGTDVSKEASAMVLLDDDFATIVAAVEEGRAIDDNIRRFLKFSLAGNIGKLLLVLLAPAFGMPLPLLPFQILWLNLVTDGVLGLGIGVEPAEAGTMGRRPRKPSEGIFARGLGLQILWQGTLIGAICLAVGFWAWRSGQEQWRAVVMTTVVLVQVFQAQAGRSSSRSVFRLSPFSNRALVAATAAILLLQAAVVAIPPLHVLFGTGHLGLEQVLVPLSAGGLVLLVVEFAGWLRRRRSRRIQQA